MWIKRRKKSLKLICNSLRVQQMELAKGGINIEVEVILIEELLFKIALKL